MSALLSYLITDPQALGVLAWASALITLLGFGIAIWQIARAKRAADAARDAALGLARRVRSRELLAKLGDSHIHLEAARSRLAAGARETAILCLELSVGAIIEAQEISRGLGTDPNDLQPLRILLARLVNQVTEMADPSLDGSDARKLQFQLRDASERLQRNIARSRYTYDNDEA
ncbi:MAG: hypothetical protein JO305_03115 [Alphaproteobacteria bacterium]|nr:hypothetical protein [Alphaproteobacteria bacterium]